MKKNLKTPTNIKRQRKLGFLARMSTKKGAQVLSRRRRKGRKVISA